MKREFDRFYLTETAVHERIIARSPIKQWLIDYADELVKAGKADHDDLIISHEMSRFQGIDLDGQPVMVVTFEL